MKIKKIIIISVILILFLLSIGLVINKNKIKNYLELKQKKDFIIEVQNIMNVASNYFLRVLDPKIDKTEPVVGEVTITKLIKENYLNEKTKIKGKIKISLLGDKTNYIIIVSNDKYYYTGNYDDLDINTIKKLN